MIVPAEQALSFTHEQPQDADAIEALLDHAYGPGRFTQVTEREREFAILVQHRDMTADRGVVARDIFGKR